MTALFQKILLFILLPFFTMVASGIIAIYKMPNGDLRSLFLHFAAGIVFSVVALEILLHVVKEQRLFQVILGFA